MRLGRWCTGAGGRLVALGKGYGLAALLLMAGCAPTAPSGNENDNVPADQLRWGPAFDASQSGFLSAVWGSGPDDVFAVGGTAEGGEVYHFDGASWSQMCVPEVPILVWVYGFGPDDVYACGEGGGMIHYDGQAWSVIDSGIDDDLFGVWGATPDDVWFVGGETSTGPMVILRYDGATVESYPAPANDRNANALFKVWGIGEKIFAVGQSGLIIEFDGDSWAQTATGAAANEDFVSLWGTSDGSIVAVGGRSSARLSVYDGSAWSTESFSTVPGLNGVYMVEPGEAVVCGQNGYVATYSLATGELAVEASQTNQTLHGVWDDGVGRVYAVGGRQSVPQAGVALLRTVEEPDDSPDLPEPAECP